MRVMLEEIDNHNVDTFVSLAGVQFGIYGVGFIERFFANATDGFITDLFYTEPLQAEFSAANFWHSPYDESSSYLMNKVFLPVVNNEVSSSNSQRYKKNFTKAQKYVFFGSPDDTTLVPWQTSLWNFYDEDGNVTPMNEHRVYQDDTFGLKTIDSRGALVTKTVPGVEHSMWIDNKDVFVTNVLPYLV